MARCASNLSPKDGRLQIVISGVSHWRSTCPSPSMARSLQKIAHRPSEAYGANLEAEWRQSEEEV